MPTDAQPRETWFWAVLAGGFLLAVALLAGLWWPRWREHTLYLALNQSSGPAFWWTPDMRQELRTGFLFQGNLSKSQAGTLELRSGTDGPVFRTTVTKGRFSFKQRLPTGPCRVRLLGPDGSATGWLFIGPLDQGRHSFNLGL